jgi:hypothetical protein
MRVVFQGIKLTDILILIISSCCVTYFNFYNWLFLTNTNPSFPSALSLFTLDGINYLKGALSMIQKGDYFFTSDIYHSPGGQIWISWVFRFFETTDPLIIKKVNFFLHLSLQVLALFFSNKLLGWKTAMLIVVSIAASSFFQIYISTLQYEVFLSLIVTLLIVLLSDEKVLNNFLFSALIALLCFFMLMIRYHYFLIALYVFFLILRSKKTKWFFLVTYLSFTSMFVFSYISNGLTYAKLSQDSGRQLRWLSPLSEGYNYPYPQESGSIKPGWQYIWNDPSSYSEQLLNRFSYLFGIKQDSYFLSSLLSRTFKKIFKIDYETLFSIIEMAFIWLGFGFCIKRFRNVALSYLGISILFYAPILIVGATQRFILPLLPIHVFFIVLALIEISKYRLQKKSPS